MLRLQVVTIRESPLIQGSELLGRVSPDCRWADCCLVLLRTKLNNRLGVLECYKVREIGLPPLLHIIIMYHSTNPSTMA